MCDAIWCAACARGGTGVGDPSRGQEAQSPMAKMSGSRVVCSVGITTSWLIRLVSSPSRSFRKSGAFTPADQTTSSEGMNSPLASTTPSARTSATRAPVRTSTPMRAQQVQRGVGNPLRQRRQDAGRRLDQHDVDVARRVDAVHAVGEHRAHRAVQFGRQFGAGRAGADDRDVQLARPHRLGLGVGAQAGVDQAAVEAAGLLGIFQRHRELRRAGRAEIVGDAADRHHQRVVRQRRAAA